MDGLQVRVPIRLDYVFFLYVSKKKHLFSVEWKRKDTEEQSFKGAYFLIQLRRDGTTRVECSDTHVTFVPYTLSGQYKETKKY